MSENTPNDLFSPVIKDKPSLPPASLEKVNKGLPFAEKKGELLGTGDWLHRKSSEGAATIGLNDKLVAKIPVGEIKRDPWEWAKTIKRSIDHFAEVSPPTSVIIARVDNEQPKPVIIQTRVEGPVLSDVTFSKLFDLKTLEGIDKILALKREWYKKETAYDFFGQKVSSNFAMLLFSSIPFFSDNVLVNQEGQPTFVDNSLDRGYWDKHSPVEKKMRMALYRLPQAIISAAIGVQKFRESIKKWRVNNS